MKIFKKFLTLCFSAVLMLSGCTPSENDSYSTSSESVLTINIMPTTTAISATEPDTQSPDYILNTNTGKFHYPDCASVNQMAEHNKKAYTGSRDDLIIKGYEPCKRCNP